MINRKRKARIANLIGKIFIILLFLGDDRKCDRT